MNPEPEVAVEKKRYYYKLTDEQKAKARARWHANKEKYRKKPDAAEPEPKTLKEGELPPMPKKDKKPNNLLTSWPIPLDLQKHFNNESEIKLPTDQTTWPMFHVRRQADLSKITRDTYRQYYSRIPRGDIWAAVRFIVAMDLNNRAQYIKSGLSYISEELYNSLYVNKDRPGSANKDYKDNLLKMMVFASLNKATKKQVFDAYATQSVSEDRHENTVPWHEWDMLAKRFIKTIMSKKEPTTRDRMDAAMVGVYSLIPPVRLDWKDVEVRFTRAGKAYAAAKGEEGKNILYMTASKVRPQAKLYWGSFKNYSAFNQPVEQELPKDLIRVLRFAIPEDQIVAGTTYKLFTVPNFSSHLSMLAEQITGKHFSNRLMRSSFIKHFHEHNSKDGVDLEKTKDIMRKLHQTNMEIHLGYVKNKTLPQLTEETDV